MADYTTHNDPNRPDSRQRFDYENKSGSGWIWGGILAIAVIVLIALGFTGDDDGATVETTAPAATAPAETGSIQDPAAGDPASTLEMAPAGDPAAPAGTETAPVDGGATAPAEDGAEAPAPANN